METAPTAAGAPPTASRQSAWRWVLAAVLALAIVGLLAYARGEPGDDGRSPEPGVSAGPALPAVVPAGSTAGA